MLAYMGGARLWIKSPWLRAFWETPCTCANHSPASFGQCTPHKATNNWDLARVKRQQSDSRRGQLLPPCGVLDLGNRYRGWMPPEVSVVANEAHCNHQCANARTKLESRVYGSCSLSAYKGKPESVITFSQSDARVQEIKERTYHTGNVWAPRKSQPESPYFRIWLASAN